MNLFNTKISSNAYDESSARENQLVSPKAKNFEIPAEQPSERNSDVRSSGDGFPVLKNQLSEPSTSIKIDRNRRRATHSPTNFNTSGTEGINALELA